MDMQLVALFRRIQLLYLWANFLENELWFHFLYTGVYLPQIFYVLYSLGINIGNVKIGPKICNIEVQMGATFE